MEWVTAETDQVTKWDDTTVLPVASWGWGWGPYTPIMGPQSSRDIS